MRFTGFWQRKDGWGILPLTIVLPAWVWLSVGPSAGMAQEEATSPAVELSPETNAVEAVAVPPIAPSPTGTNLTAIPDTTNAPPAEATISAEQAWKSFMQLQGQMDTTLLAIERSRREREIVEQQSRRQLEQRLKMIERSLTDQRAQEAKAARDANQNMLTVAGLFAGVGFLAMVVTSIFHFRAMNKLGGIIASLAPDAHFGMGSTALPSAREERLLAAQAGRGEKGARLLSAIERLEQRIHELEHTSQSSLNPEADMNATSGGAGNGHGMMPGHAPSAGAETEMPGAGGEAAADEGLDAKITLILGKGQALLNMGRAEEAIACFEDALAVQPRNAEAWIKKGSAMEKLNRLSEAIECYDEAIAANEGMTLAYLYKGGVFNRLERYNEALACYEKALQTQKAGVATPVTGTMD